mmetsp:Transcript_7603/g.11289  ORF Transcript_7603/g.11289 Transcript_7603/m.11289 type:complete len:226 (+) Transcript_7603:776-1453(+)
MDSSVIPNLHASSEPPFKFLNPLPNMLTSVVSPKHPVSGDNANTSIQVSSDSVPIILFNALNESTSCTNEDDGDDAIPLSVTFRPLKSPTPIEKIITPLDLTTSAALNSPPTGLVGGDCPPSVNKINTLLTKGLPSTCWNCVNEKDNAWSRGVDPPFCLILSIASFTCFASLDNPCIALPLLSFISSRTPCPPNCTIPKCTASSLILNFSDTNFTNSTCLIKSSL